MAEDAHTTIIPDLIIVDGGRGQLSSACKELHRLGLHEAPVIGLAKEFEEIYRPGMETPLRLSHDTSALKLLQRIPVRPNLLGVFAGKINYPALGPLDRTFIRFIMWMTKGPTDPTGVFEFTDWSQVDAFGAQVIGAGF
ncbi:MAG: flavodoxin domain-containing protein [Chloroflexales bacterium]